MADDSPDVTHELDRLLAVVRELRTRCPWDREQTVASLARHLVEEAYEAADAIAQDSNAGIADELGDMLAQILFAGTIAEEENRFQLTAMVSAARDKLVRRHPHVYSDVKASSSEQVVRNWSEIKRAERERAGHSSALDGIARALPALTFAQKLGERARSAGMDWRDAAAVLAKVREELDEVERALRSGDRDAAEEEIGDLMLAMANVPRFLGGDAELTLRRACDKFIARFERVEQLCRERSLDLARLTDPEIDRLWNEAKSK